MREAILKLRVLKKCSGIHELFCKNADKASTAEVMLLAWKIKLVNSFSKHNYKDISNITKNFKMLTSSETEIWEQGRETLKAALLIKAEKFFYPVRIFFTGKFPTLYN